MGDLLDLVVPQVDLFERLTRCLVHLNRLGPRYVHHLAVDEVHDAEVLDAVLAAECGYLRVIEGEHLELVSVLHLQVQLIPRDRLRSGVVPQRGLFFRCRAAGGSHLRKK